MILAQVVISVGQVGYTAVTSRILAPEAFGAYAVALSATGFLGLAFGALPSALLAREDVDENVEAAFHYLSWALGVGAALLLIIGAPLWGSLWGSASSAEVTRLLGLQVITAAPATVQLALLRREGRTRADAAAQAIGGTLGFLLGAVMVWQTRSALALVANPIGTAVGQLVVARLLRRTRSRLVRPRGHGQAIAFATNVALQNIVFFLFMSLPSWVVSRVENDDTLGQYARASLLVGLPATTLAAALTRALQPNYRHLSDPAVRFAAVSDAAIVTSALTFTPFLLVAVLAHPLMRVVLGPGWEEAASFAVPLAIGFGLYVVFTVLANAAEMFGEFRVVRRSQAAMAAAIAVPLATAFAAESTFAAAWAMVAIGGAGLIVLLWGLDGLAVDGRSVAKSLTREAGFALVAVGLGRSLALVVEQAVHPGLYGSMGLTIVLTTTGAAAVIKRQPVMEVVTRRNLLPALARSKEQ